MVEVLDPAPKIDANAVTKGKRADKNIQSSKKGKENKANYCSKDTHNNGNDVNNKLQHSDKEIIVAESETFILLHNKETIKNNEKREFVDKVLIDSKKEGKQHH